MPLGREHFGGVRGVGHRRLDQMLLAWRGSSDSIVTVKNCVEPPMAVASALCTSGSCIAAARPMTCRAASPARTRPVTPIGFVHSVPPDGLTAQRAVDVEGALVGQVLRVTARAEPQRLELRKLERAERIVDLDDVDLAHRVGDARLRVAFVRGDDEFRRDRRSRCRAHGPMRSPMNTVFDTAPMPVMNAGRVACAGSATLARQYERSGAGRARADVVALVRPRYARRGEHLGDADRALEMRIGVGHRIAASAHDDAGVLLLGRAVLVHVALGRRARSS